MLQIKIFTFSPIEENTYLLYNENKQAAIIDPGCYTDAEKQTLANFVEQNGLTVTHLLLTHCHLDHVFGLHWAAAHYGLTPAMHRTEEMVLSFAPASGKNWGLPFTHYEGAINYLEPAATIHIGADELNVLFTPGHSPGHICFYCAAQDFVIGGDVLFLGSIGRTDLPGGHHQTLIESIRSRLFTLPNHTKVYPGHGPATTIEFEKAHNPFLQH